MRATILTAAATIAAGLITTCSAADNSSAPQYFSYPGAGEALHQSLNYNQAVRVGNYIHIAGQGGWDPSLTTNITVTRDLAAQYDQAFANVDLTLKNAGGKGWSQVFRVNSYHVPLNQEALELLVAGFAKWMPDHQPVATAVGVQRLALDDMRLEIEVVAFDDGVV